MRIFKLREYDIFNNIISHVHKDNNKLIKTPKKKTPKRKKTLKNKNENLKAAEEDIDAEADLIQETIADDDVGMNGPEGRVYWPPDMEY